MCQLGGIFQFFKFEVSSKILCLGFRRMLGECLCGCLGKFGASWKINHPLGGSWKFATSRLVFSAYDRPLSQVPFQH